MENLRLVNVEVKSSQDLTLEFSHKLSSGISVSNIQILSTNASIPDASVLSVKIKDNFLFVKCKPLTPFVAYKVKAVKTLNYTFNSLNNTASLLQDNVGNVYEIIGPIEKENFFKQVINQTLSDGVYNIDNGTVVSTIVDSLSKNLDIALDAIKNVKNENYISFDVIDELKTRGSGPFDKLNEGSAYEIIRVGPRPTNTFSEETFVFSSKNYKLISLQETYNTEILSTNSFDTKGYFNVVNFNLNLNKSNVIKIKSIVFTLSTLNPIYTYNIEKYGYQLLDPKYDPDFASKYFQLESNQVKLNEEILKDPDFDIAQIVKIDIEYYYKNTTKIIYNPDIFSRKDIVREVLPPISTNFFLKNSNIIDANNNTPSSNGLVFTNLASNAPNPAFLYEIDFRYEELPFSPGQYSVNYETGNIYVYGQSSSNLGSGEEPPVVSYTYKQSFQSEIDYVYDSNTYDLAILPKGKAIDKTLYVKYNYEIVYQNGLDYKASLHEESLNERINNNLLALNVLQTQNYPVTNVFRIYNETSGELYSLSRFDGNKVYFRYTNPPRILQNEEVVDFHSFSEKLIPINYSTNTNTNTIIVAKFQLSKSNIISSTNDRIANFKNTSLILDNNIFQVEKHFINENSILDVGEYVVDYANGFLFVGVDSLTIEDFGEANYKYSDINPQFSHVLYVNKLSYIQPSTEEIKVNASSVLEDTISVNGLANAYEDNVNNSPYLLISNNVGYFENTSFVPKVKNEVSEIFGLYEYEDFINSDTPVNFANFSVFNNKNINVSNFEKTFFETIQYSVLDGYYVEIPKQVGYTSSNLTVSTVVTDLASSNEIDVLSFSIEEATNKIILDTLSLGSVKIQLLMSINNLSRIVVDYARGSLVCNYNYLADEILINYEYGSNSLDFREGTVSTNTPYYVSYKVGALRDGLLRNFSTLVNVDELSNIDPSFNRERYRDALYAAMSSFILGPTIPAIKNIVKQITHVTPKVIESQFNNWSVGESLLSPQQINSIGEFELLPSKHGNGVLIDNGSITFPSFNNLNLEEGSLGFWVTPQWNGIDNLNNILVEVLEDNLDISTDKIFIGATEIHPESNIFTLTKNVIKGTPNTNKDGVYFYLDKDPSNLFERWYVQVVDGYSTPTNTFKIKLQSDFYDFKVMDGYPTSVLSTNSKLTIVTNSSYKNELYGFIADSKKYFIDIKKDKNRFSIYKDKSGYLVFEVIDNNSKKHSISTDISSWNFGENHQVYVSWKLNSKLSRDELHLFVDGTEVQNSLTYSSNIRNYIRQDFRTTAKETFVGVAGKDIVGSVDLETTIGSPIVSSLINFSAFNISPGDSIFIKNDLFNENGYQILSVSGQDLTLDTNMPVSLTNLEFSVNQTNFDGYGRYYLNTNNYFYKLSYYFTDNDLTLNNTNIVLSTNDFTNIVSVGDLIRINYSGLEDYYTIISVNVNQLELDSTINVSSSGVEFFIYSTEETELRSPRAEISDYELSKNTITIKNGLNSNELLFATSLGLNHEVVKAKYYQWSDNLSNIIKTQLPRPTSISDVEIYKLLLNNTLISSSNSTILGNTYDSEILTDNPINSQSGRVIKVEISGTNVDFTNPLTVEVFGYVGYSSTSEILSFNDYGSLNTTNLFISVSKVKILADCINPTKALCSIKVSEFENIFEPEVSYYTPVLKYSYVVSSGSNLEKFNDTTVVDYSNNFSLGNIGDTLVIEDPITMAGFYKITNVDGYLLELDPLSTGYPLPINSFTNGIYKIYKTVDNASGIGNGFFYFEPLDYPGQQYLLRKGFYEFSYPAYLSIDYDFGELVHVGTDYLSQNHCNSIINELAVYNIALTDVRTGEYLTDNDSVTKNFNSIKGTKLSKNLTFLSKFNSFPFENEANYYVALKDNNIIYSNNSVNSEFNNSIYLKDRSLNITNLGYLDSKKEGTIEFWISPIYDTLYDFNTRYYFDATSLIEEELISTNKKLISLSSKADQIISVKTLDSDFDYFSGGSIDYVRKDSVNEVVTSTSSNKVVITNPALQVLYVKINNFLNTDYFDGGSISSDGKTIYLNKNLPNNNVQVIVSYKPKTQTTINEQVIKLGKPLPQNNTKVKVIYIPKGTNGDRISIYKDANSNLNFEITASNKLYAIKAPIVWEKNSWHRVKASYKFNSSNENLLLFIDGYRHSQISYEGSIYFNNYFESTILGDGYDGYFFDKEISFKDTINYFTLGSDFSSRNYGNISLDNLRLSNKYRNSFKYLNESIDISYLGVNSLPVVKDLYTTYLLDSDIEYNLFEDFCLLINKKSGIFEFTLDIFDSFNILKDNPQSKLIMEKLLKILKPANSRIFLNYI